MNTGSVYSLFDIIVVVCGVYIIYLCVDMKRTGTVKENMMLPKGLDLKKCKDMAGFTRYIMTKQLVLGFLAILSGIVGLIQDYTQTVSPWIYILSLIIFFADAIWYACMMRKATRTFW